MRPGSRVFRLDGGLCEKYAHAGDSSFPGLWPLYRPPLQRAGDGPSGVGAYGTIWPVVHQHLGVRPDMGRGELDVIPQLPPGTPDISGENIRLGDGSATVSAKAEGDTYTTTVDPAFTLEDLEELTIGHTIPRDARVGSITLNGAPARDYRVRETNRGKEVFVDSPTTGEQTLVVETGR